MTPELQASGPYTPRSVRILRSNNRGVQTGKFTASTTLLKTEKSLEILLAENELSKQELGMVRASEELNRVTRGSCQKETYPQGQLFDPDY